MDQKLVLLLHPLMVKITYTSVYNPSPKFPKKRVSSWINTVLNQYGFANGSISYVFMSDEELLELNKTHLNHDWYTDVITFNFNEKDSLSGEILVSIDRVKENAKLFGDGDFINELLRVMIHGVLHLVGFKDDTEEEEKLMRLKENEALSLFVSRETK